MKQVITTKDVRYNGADLPAGSKIELDEVLAQTWIEKGLAVVGVVMLNDAGVVAVVPVDPEPEPEPEDDPIFDAPPKKNKKAG